MIEEKEPLYFKEFRNLIIKKFEKIDERFDKLEVKIEKDIAELAISTADEFRRMDERFDGIDQKIKNLEDNTLDLNIKMNAMRDDMEEIREHNRLIEKHIARYEIRATTFEEILLQDFKPRILALEKLA